MSENVQIIMSRVKCAFIDKWSSCSLLTIWTCTEAHWQACIQWGRSGRLRRWWRWWSKARWLSTTFCQEERLSEDGTVNLPFSNQPSTSVDVSSSNLNEKNFEYQVPNVTTVLYFTDYEITLTWIIGKKSTKAPYKNKICKNKICTNEYV